MNQKLAVGLGSLFAFGATALLVSGCGPTPTTEFMVETQYCGHPVGDPPNTPCNPNVDSVAPMPGVSISGNYYGPIAGITPQGSVYQFGTVFSEPNVETQSSSPGQPAYALISNALAPAYWNLYFIYGFNCGNYDLYNTGTVPGTSDMPFWEYLAPQAQITAASGAGWIEYCNQPLNTEPIPADSTNFAILGSLPSMLTLGAQVPFTTTYGMPLLYIYDGSGLVATETATSLSSDGSEATFPFPSSLTQNAYSLATVNQTGSVYGNLAAGSSPLIIASSQTIAGNPFGVAPQVVSTTWQSAYNPDPYGDETCQGQWTYNSGTNTSPSPVVTLYSLDSVSNGGTIIPVGPNPTAIALYDSQDSQVNQDSDPCNTYQSDTTQMSRAVVANSGNNTVSILDIVNNVLLSTVTVGNQPVALAVSSDGSTTYVANYSDSTVTEVNLNTETVVTTIQVGGQPTSVALTAGGVLWVGGVGFLTEINPQTMSVVATESTEGETIAALAFSDGENELVATTVDTSGNVHVDEVNPSTVQPGGTYTTVASNQVSTLGAYVNPQTQAQVRGFTSTLATTTVPVSTNQPGAPPLVVQDGWAVVTATPTGFTISDLSGNIVLVSETTPSPVAAIAVDPNLNVAYLTMPDSNTLLTVPLPGTNGSGTSSAPASFALTATNNNPAQTALSLGHSMSYTVTVSPLYGFTGPVVFSLSGLPAGVTGQFSPTSITTAGNAVLTLTAAYSNSTFIGNSNITVSGASSSAANSTGIALTTQPLQYAGYCSVQ